MDSVQTWVALEVMRKGVFQAAVGLGVLLPALALGFAVTRPAVRRMVRAFVSPLPGVTVPLTPEAGAPAGSSGVVALPTPTGPAGAESPELQSMVPDGGARDERAERTALFPSQPSASAATANDAYERPPGLHRPEIASRDDAGIDRVLAYFAHDARGHGALLAALKRSGRYRADVERVLRAWKLPEELVAIVFVESGFSPTFTDGGAGMWAMPPSLGKAYGLTMREKYDERRAVVLSSEAAAHHLADLRERLGSWELAIFAFGVGYPQALDAVARHAGPPDFWPMAADLDPEGRRYVFRVLAVATILANLDRLGFDGVRPDDPVATSDLEIPAGTPLGTVARAAGTSLQHLRELNPEYLADVVPDTGFAMTMHLPSGGLARAKELLMPLLYSPSGGLARQGDSRFDWGSHDLPSSVRGDGGDADDAGPARSALIPSKASGGGRSFYRAEDGDTLDSLAARFGVARETIAGDNALDPSAALRAGQLLTVRRPADAPPAPRPKK